MRKRRDELWWNKKLVDYIGMRQVTFPASAICRINEGRVMPWNKRRKPVRANIGRERRPR